MVGESQNNLILSDSNCALDLESIKVKVVIETSGRAMVEFETEEELRAEYSNNISAGGLSLPTETILPEFTALQLTLKLAGGGNITVPASVVRVLEGALKQAYQEGFEAGLARAHGQGRRGRTIRADATVDGLIERIWSSGRAENSTEISNPSTTPCHDVENVTM